MYGYFDIHLSVQAMFSKLKFIAQKPFALMQKQTFVHELLNDAAQQQAVGVKFKTYFTFKIFGIKFQKNQ